MQGSAHAQVAEGPIVWAIGRVRGKAKNLSQRIVEAFAVCANAWEAAGLYEALSKLSDAELERRGMPRSELHRSIFEMVTWRT